MTFFFSLPNVSSFVLFPVLFSFVFLLFPFLLSLPILQLDSGGSND